MSIQIFDLANANLHLRWASQSASPMHRTKMHFRLKENGFPRRFAPRNDSGGLYIALSFPYWQYPPTGNPSVGYADSSPKKGAKMVRRKITGIPLAPSDEGAVAQATEGEIIPRIAGHENQQIGRASCRERV